MVNIFHGSESLKNDSFCQHGDVIGSSMEFFSPNSEKISESFLAGIS